MTREHKSVLLSASPSPPSDCSPPTSRRWRRSLAPHLGAARCHSGRCCLSPGVLLLLRLQVEVAGGCTACASPTPATAWPGRPMTPPCPSQREARAARKLGAEPAYLCVCVCLFGCVLQQSHLCSDPSGWTVCAPRRSLCCVSPSLPKTAW